LAENQMFGTLPREFVGGIRTNTDKRIFLLQVLVVSYSFTAAAFRSDTPSIASDPGALARLAIPVTAAMFGLLLRDAFTNSADRPPHASAVDVIVAFGFAFLLEAILSTLKPELMLARLWAPTQGGFVGISLLVASRSLFPPGVKISDGTGLISLTEIRWKAEELRKSIRRYARAYLAVCTLFCAIAAYALVAGDLKIRLASCVVAAGCGYLLYQSSYPIGERDLAAAALSESTLFESYRGELQGQIVFLQRTGYWYYGSLLPGVTILLWGNSVYPYWLLVVIFIAAEWNHRMADRLRQDLDALGASTGSSSYYSLQCFCGNRKRIRKLYIRDGGDDEARTRVTPYQPVAARAKLLEFRGRRGFCAACINVFHRLVCTGTKIDAVH
jgi:hypothetical protein